MKDVIGRTLALGILAGLTVIWFSAEAAPGRITPVQMGGGMMGGGMMGGGTGSSSQREPAASSAAQHLQQYVRSNGLTCFSCHALYSNGMGPSLSDVAKRYHGLRGGGEILADSIAHGVAGKWTGYRAMPGGLASSKQAKELARLILSLGQPTGERGQQGAY